MIWIYCKTDDDPKEIGEYICESNYGHEKNERTRGVKYDDEECWLMEIDPQNQTSAMVYRIGHEIVVIEIDESCASNVIEPLLKKYGFYNVKWLLTK